MKRDLYAEVSARIVAELEAGAAPWVKPWSASPGANTPCNAVSISSRDASSPHNVPRDGGLEAGRRLPEPRGSGSPVSLMKIKARRCQCKALSAGKFSRRSNIRAPAGARA